MSDSLYSALFAVGIGALVGIALFVPFVALTYRRRGRLTLGRTLTWAAGLVYFVAIWSYTLLPIPESDDYRCASPVLSLRPMVQDIADAIARGHPLTDFALMQIVLNVLLFVPLGFFLRVLAHRGIVIAFVTGLAISLLIETTQLTGVWGLFPCAYRLFDVGDLLTNTTGAVLGSLLALFVPRRWRIKKTMDADALRPLTRPRRLIGMLCDALAAWLFAAGVSIAVQVWLQYVTGDRDAVLEGTIAATVSTWTTLVAWALFTLVTGRTVGDVAVDIRYRGGSLPRVLARLLRFVGGIGGYLILGMTPWPLLQTLFAIAALTTALIMRDGAGLPALLSGQRLTDSRADAEATGATPMQRR